MVNSRRIATALLTLTTLVVLDNFAAAQPVPTKLPDSVHLFPAGAQRGTTVKVHIGVEQTPPHAKFFIDGEGVVGNSELATEVFDVGQSSPRRAPTEVPIHYPRQWLGEIRVASDAGIGTAHWDITCAAGGSTGTLPFVIGELAEFVESESNSTPQSAEAIGLPVTVNGQIHGERDLDYYRFTLEPDQVVYCEVLARRLGSRLEPAVAILNLDGEVMAYQEDQLGDDPVLAFKSPEGGVYLLQVGNVTVHGSPAHVYRVNLTHTPVAPSVYPIGAPAGQPTSFTFSVMSGDGQTKTWVRELTLPADSGSDVYRHFDEALTHPVSLRTLPPGTPVIQSQTRNQRARTQHARDQHAPDQHARPQETTTEISVGQVSNGQLSPIAPHVYSLSVVDGQPLDIRVISPAECGGISLLQMEIVNPDGKSIHRTRLAPSPSSTKAYHHISNPSIGKYTIRISSLSPERSVGGYQLDVLPAKANFQLHAGSDCLSVTQGASIEILVTATRHGGFNGPIQLRLDGLPDDIVAENTVIPEGKITTKLKLSIPETALSTRHEIRLLGTASLGDEATTRPVLVQHRGHDSAMRAVHQPLREVIAMTVRHKPVFRLYCEEAYQYARRGTVYPYRMTLERMDGFKENVIVQQADRQNRDLDGIEFLQTTIAPDQSDFMMPIYLPETMHINIQSQSQLYTQAYASFTDAHGVKQHFLAVAEKRNMLRTMPTVVKIYSQDTTLSGTPGQTVVARFKLERTSNMRNAMQLLLHDSTSQGFLSPPQDLERDKELVEIPVLIPGNMKPGEYKLVFRATGPVDAKPDQMAITSAAVTIEVR